MTTWPRLLASRGPLSAYLLGALVIMLPAVLWQSPLAQAWRPPVVFGISPPNLLLAWAPEGLALGVLCFWAEYCAGGRRPWPGRQAAMALVSYLLTFIPIWLLGVLLPGIRVLSTFGASVQQLKDVFPLGKLADGLPIGSLLVVAYATMATVYVLAVLLVAAALAVFLQPQMMALSRPADACTPRPLRARYAMIVLAGSAFWAARLLATQWLPDQGLRGMANAAAVVLLAGMHARTAAQPHTIGPGSDS